MKTLKYMGNVLITIVFLYGASTLAQEKPDTTKAGNKPMKHGHQTMNEMKHDSSASHKMQDMKMMKDSSHHMMMDMKGMKGMKHEMPAALDSSVIRTGEIDLKAIDENKDGKVYQCQMDFNVLSDQQGKDPKCGMKLQEVTLEKAKENLLKHNFKVK